MSILSRKMMADPSTSNWLKNQIKALDGRDPLDMARDAEALVRLAYAHFDEGIELAKAIEKAFDGAPRGNIFAQNASEGRGINPRIARAIQNENQG